MALVLHASTDRHEMWGGPKRYIRIVLHDTTEDLRRAARRYRPDGNDWTEAAGCFHPAEVKADEDPHWAGTLRLSREVLHTEVVVHECAHAAAAIYRMDVAVDVRLGSGCGPREERFAYIVGDLCHAVNDVLHAAHAF